MAALASRVHLTLAASGLPDPVAVARKLNLSQASHRVAMFLLSWLYGRALRPTLVALYQQHHHDRALRHLICYCLALAPYDAVNARRYGDPKQAARFWQAILLEHHEHFTSGARRTFSPPANLDWREIASHWSSNILMGAVKEPALVDDLSRREIQRVRARSAPGSLLYLVDVFASPGGRALVAEVIHTGSQAHLNLVSSHARFANRGDYPEVFQALQEELERDRVTLARRAELFAMLAAFKDADDRARLTVVFVLNKLPRGIVTDDNGLTDKVTIYQTSFATLRDHEPVLEALDAEISALLRDRRSDPQEVTEWASTVVDLLRESKPHALKQRIASRALKIPGLERTDGGKVARAILDGKQ